MSIAKIYPDSKSIDFDITKIESRQEPTKVLMCTPDCFEVIDVKNPYMKGNTGLINKSKAHEQWHAIKRFYQLLVTAGQLEKYVEIKGAVGCEDMVFAANQTLPWRFPDGSKKVILSKMKHPSRQKEVPFFKELFIKKGYEILELETASHFEGMGDTIPHSGKQLLYGGYGHRSDLKAYEEISQLLDVKIILLELIDEKFYHLDTCFLPLDEDTLMLYPGAFTEDGLATLTKTFKHIIEIPLHEAENGFALNAHVISCSKSQSKHVLIQKGNEYTIAQLKALNFKVTETETSEFMKSGGSVFCMKMMLY
ncbi:MAG TPA: arginine deiminase family protein [Cytophagaceae bacterium]|jgi:N-dimethylarginine dimethylaminohydrolase